MVDHARIALFTLHHPPTPRIRAGYVACIAPSIEQQNRLIPLFGSFLKCLGQAWAEQMDPSILPTALFLSEVDDVHLGQ